jgi:hypothetical protein
MACTFPILRHGVDVAGCRRATDDLAALDSSATPR